MTEDFRRWQLAYASASASLIAIARGVTQQQLSLPGLGVWTIRDLIGHASRSMLTIETYLKAPTDVATIPSAVAYYLSIRDALNADPEAIAQRGRDAGAALGDEPADALATIAGRVGPLVENTPPATVLTVGTASIAFSDYLPTRVFELTVHGLDLCRALGVAVPPLLREPIGACLELAAAVAAEAPNSDEVLLALTGRAGLPAGYSVV